MTPQEYADDARELYYTKYGTDNIFDACEYLTRVLEEVENTRAIDSLQFILAAWNVPGSDEGA